MAPGGWLGDGSLHHGERSGAIIGEGIADGQAGDIRMDPLRLRTSDYRRLREYHTLTREFVCARRQ
jgi:hypothetical protein